MDDRLLPYLIVLAVLGLLWMAHVAYAAWSGGLAKVLGQSMDRFRQLPWMQRLGLILPFVTLLAASMLWWLFGVAVGAFVTLGFFAPIRPGEDNRFEDPLTVGLMVYAGVVIVFALWAVCYAEYYVQRSGIAGQFRRMGLVLIVAAIPALLIRATPNSSWAVLPLLIFGIAGAVLFIPGVLLGLRSK